MISGRAKNLTQAADIANCSHQYLSAQFHNKPHCAEYLRQKAAGAIAIGAGYAAAKQIALMDAQSEQVAFKASARTLDTAGIGPARAAGVNVNIGQVTAGWIIDLSEPGQPARPGDVINSAEAMATAPQLPPPADETNG